MNAEQMLGSMLFSSLGGKAGRKLTKKLRKGMGGYGGVGTGMLGMGALGVAIAAFDHFVVDKNQPQAIPQGGAPQQFQSMQQPGVTPMAPPVSPPPPPPGAAPATPPNLTQPAPLQQNTDTDQQALILIRAMIAAANADGSIDTNERNQILGRLEQAGLSGEDRNYILNEFLNPPNLNEIASQVNTPELAKQVYAVSLFSIEVDTEAEKNYMELLAQKLSLSQQDIAQIEDELGLNEPEGE